MMPYVNNNGVKIYYEIEGKGPPLILHSGLTVTHENFRAYRYTEQLRENYQLILIDARGHGKSDKPHTPESYSLKNMVRDLTTILDILEIEKANFFGYSIGGKTGLGILRYAPDRFNSVIICGWGAVETDSEDEIKRNQSDVERYRKTLERGVDLLVDMFVKDGMSIEDANNQAHNNDWEAVFALKLSIEHIGYDVLLPSVKLPCLIIIGEEDSFYDRAKNTADLIDCVEFVSLPGLNHTQTFRRSDLVVPSIIEFLCKHNR